MSNHEYKDSARLASIFKALSNPNRLSIFLKLASCCPPGTKGCDISKASAYVGELGKGVGIVPSTVSHHIRELQQAGLINLRRQGQFIECCIEPETLKELSGFFARLQEL